jgi:hypothetical protein
MSGFRSCIWTMQADGPALSNTTTATSLIGTTNPKGQIPVPMISVPGVAFEITCAGRVSNVVTSQHTLTLDVRFGSVIVFNGGVMTPSTTAHTNVPFLWKVYLTVRAVGQTTTANMMGQASMISRAFVDSGANADSAQTQTVLMTPETAPAVGTGFDSTVVQTVDIFGTWGTGVGASDSVTLHQAWIEVVNWTP